jgi:uncharacterized membrane protein (GlpM family)
VSHSGILVVLKGFSKHPSQLVIGFDALGAKIHCDTQSISIIAKLALGKKETLQKFRTMVKHVEALHATYVQLTDCSYFCSSLSWSVFIVWGWYCWTLSLRYTAELICWLLLCDCIFVSLGLGLAFGLYGLLE